MSTDPPPRKPLTPIERVQLEALLAKVDAYRAADEKRLKAEEKRLRAEQERLAKAEAVAAVRLDKLQDALDDTTTKLNRLLLARRPDSEAAVRELYAIVTSVREGLPKFACDLPNMTGEKIAEALEGLMAAKFPEIFGEPPAPTQADNEAATDAQRAATAKAIIRAGKIRRAEPLDDDPTVVKFPRKDK